MLVRKDLTAAQQLCQAIHAAHEAGIRYGDPELVSSVVVCTVPDQASLVEAQKRLEWKGVKNYLFHEHGDEFEPVQDGLVPTALATEPLDRTRKRWMSGYPLWR